MRFILFVLALIMAYTPPTSACSIRLGTETSFRPFIDFNDNNWQGVTIELLHMLVTDVGCQLDIIPSPWLRSLRLIERGELDVVVHMTYSLERSNQFYFIGPHHLEEIYLIGTAKVFAGITNVAQLKNYGSGTIAFLNGSYYGEEINNLINAKNSQKTFVPIVSNKDKISLLLNYRVDAVLEDIMAFMSWRNELGAQDTKLKPILKVYENPVYFGFNKKTISTTQFDQLANAWQARFEDGSIQRILDKYQVDDSHLKLLEPAPKM
ncbi:MAG: substrate-binding periplasmic protein [Alishewanella aestuarii]